MQLTNIVIHYSGTKITWKAPSFSFINGLLTFVCLFYKNSIKENQYIIYISFLPYTLYFLRRTGLANLIYTFVYVYLVEKNKNKTSAEYSLGTLIIRRYIYRTKSI